ncbi:uncharacterized protein TRIADDRAFT_54815 [Trichoplax adhaerens]|uniref:Cytochrome P450 n=1 Tax=Trichoplax adhaerens TaxID=10228 RepID=B3RT29_TRIAD|nr:hypothetical protein TRIADDRAFT_54815 [Trichoplax adhaerens]EDV26620.1 hypothetical protein TRIADDRAFT_54815 [Trichoplax adhaerens]|eukprot:XP_002110616.1 hypothetical protein TRIADDRAFT_54815 [Trichoplax adhaerens]
MEKSTSTNTSPIPSDMMTWVAMGIALCIGYLIKQLVEMLTSPLYEIPGPPTWSPFGQVSTIMKEPPGDSYIKWSEQYGGILRYVFPIYHQKVALIDPDYIKHVLVTNCTKYKKPEEGKKFLLPAIGEGLVLLEGQKHAKARKIINPAFKHSKIKELVPIFHRFAQALVEYWQSRIDNCGGQEAILEVHEDLSRVTLDIICKSAFDYECNALEDPTNEASVAFAKVLGGLDFDWTFFIPFYNYLPTPGNLKTKRVLSLCHNTINRVIKERLEKETLDEEKCLLDILLSLRDEDNNTGFTETELKDHIMTFMAAGHETTSVAIAWTLYALAGKPEIQNKARQEIYKALHQCDNITWDILDGLTYLDSVVKESLRLYSPVPVTFREALADDMIGDYFIPKGTAVTLLPPHRTRSRNYKKALSHYEAFALFKAYCFTYIVFIMITDGKSRCKADFKPV